MLRFFKKQASAPQKHFHFIKVKRRNNALNPLTYAVYRVILMSFHRLNVPPFFCLLFQEAFEWSGNRHSSRETLNTKDARLKIGKLARLYLLFIRGPPLSDIRNNNTSREERTKVGNVTSGSCSLSALCLIERANLIGQGFSTRRFPRE